MSIFLYKWKDSYITGLYINNSEKLHEKIYETNTKILLISHILYWNELEEYLNKTNIKIFIYDGLVEHNNVECFSSNNILLPISVRCNQIKNNHIIYHIGLDCNDLLNNLNMYRIRFPFKIQCVSNNGLNKELVKSTIQYNNHEVSYVSKVSRAIPNDLQYVFTYNKKAFENYVKKMYKYAIIIPITSPLDIKADNVFKCSNTEELIYKILCFLK